MSDHDEYCSRRAEPPTGACDCETGRRAKIREGMTAHQAEISQSWEMLEDIGFPPEACEWPSRDITGLLPEAIKCALECVIRQREELLAEVTELRKGTIAEPKWVTDYEKQLTSDDGPSAGPVKEH